MLVQNFKCSGSRVIAQTEKRRKKYT